jgi:hypothetical protein
MRPETIFAETSLPDELLHFFIGFFARSALKINRSSVEDKSGHFVRMEKGS